MFNNLLAFWKGKDFLTNVLEDFRKMLEESHEMFKMTCECILEGKIITRLEDKIYDLDKKINLLEKDIRRRIVEHLSIQPSVDVPMSLLLMSVVKDAERLGDYAKNFYQIGRITRIPLNREIFSDFFKGMDKDIIKMFDDTKKAFIESNEEAATKIWQSERSIVKACEGIIKSLADSNLNANEAVAFTLVSRYFKRIAAHLTNIATSVILPLSELDFFDERKRNEEA